MTRLRVIRSICVLGALSILGAGLLEAEEGGKRAFEITDYYRTAFVGSPAVSPDGELVAISVRHYDFEEGETWSNLWLMAADGSNQRQMTWGKKSDYGPFFSPDGKWLYFSSSRSDSSQVWKMAVPSPLSQILTSRVSPGMTGVEKRASIPLNRAGSLPHMACNRARPVNP